MDKAKTAKDVLNRKVPSACRSILVPPALQFLQADFTSRKAKISKCDRSNRHIAAALILEFLQAKK